MPLVKTVWVKITATGAEKTKAELADVAARAREIGDMDPTIKVKVDSDAMRKLSAMRVELRALAADGDKGGLKNLAERIRAIGAGSEDARAKLAAMRLELDAIAALGRDGRGGGGGGGLLGAIPNPFGLGSVGSLPAPAVIGGLIVALTALPFLAQAAAGAITLGLGGALTALGVYAEMGTRSVRYQFSQLVSGKDGIAASLKNISPAFGQALTTILSAARTFLPQFIRAFGPALNAIAGPLKSLGVMITGTLASPQVAASIREMGRAFGSILAALTPMVPGMFTSIADGFINIARAVEKNPKAIAAMISGLAHLIGALLDVIAWLAQVAAYLEQHFIPAWDRTQRFLDQWRHAIAAQFSGFYHDTLAIFNRLKTDIANIWTSAWNNTVGATIRGVSSVMARVRAIPGQIRGALGGLPAMMFQVGANLMQGLVSGIQSMIGGVISQVVSVGSSIISHIKSALGIGSPSRITYQHGIWLAQGLAMGMDAGSGLTAAAAGRLGRSAIPGLYGAPGGVLRLEVVGGGGGMLDRLFISWLKNYVRVTGGGGPQSVQRALGQVWR